jgi:predicted nucleic acid-binding protein
MLVVADSSPLILLVNISHVEILPTLFGQVVIPPEVSAELRHLARPQAVRAFIASRPSWLLEQSPTAINPIPSLHAGELAAISLAQELKADLLLIDDARGRQAAAERGIPLTGTVGVIEFAADRGLLDLDDAFSRMKKTDFWISHQLLDERLRLRAAARRRGGHDAGS